VEIRGSRIGVVVCVEAELEPWVHVDPENPVDALIWPCFWGHDEKLGWDQGSKTDDLDVKKNVSLWRIPLIQANCIDSPDGLYTDTVGGRGLVLNGDGSTAFRGRVNSPDLYYVDIEPGRGIVGTGRVPDFPTSREAN
jgi:hypothetical protein